MLANGYFVLVMLAFLLYVLFMLAVEFNIFRKPMNNDIDKLQN